jgi:hypothetical protein
MPFCKFCKDSGKSQREFTSHYTKDKPGKDGKVVCPTILSNDCRYCHKKGHAKSHCALLREKNNRKRLSGPNRFRRRPQKSPKPLNGWSMTTTKQQPSKRVGGPKRKEPRSISFNAFAALHEEDDDRKVANEPVPKVMKPKAAGGSWAKKPNLSKEAIQQRLATKKQELAVEEHLKECDAGMTPLVTIKEAYANIKKIPTYIGSWADAVDSDSEDESDDEEEINLDGHGRPATDNSAW